MREIMHRLLQVKLPRMPLLSRQIVVWLWLAGGLVFTALLFMLLKDKVFPLLQTRGEVANRQRDLIVFATALAALVLIPVYTLLFLFAWRYREGHRREYAPEWDTHKVYEAIWWGIPIAIIGVLAVVTWVTTHSLDPYKPLASSQAPLKIQAIALEWKWLFIYPEEDVASINEVAFPVNRPVQFSITSDAPMNSFWIPQLAGQIYAMSGMSTTLNIMADTAGTYRGMSSNISGKGFADMTFNARAMNEHHYQTWLQASRRSGNVLTDNGYGLLARPGTMRPKQYALEAAGLYGRVVGKYMESTPPTANEVKPTEAETPSRTHMMHDGMMMEGM